MFDKYGARGGVIGVAIPRSRGVSSYRTLVGLRLESAFAGGWEYLPCQRLNYILPAHYLYGIYIIPPHLHLHSPSPSAQKPASHPVCHPDASTRSGAKAATTASSERSAAGRDSPRVRTAFDWANAAPILDFDQAGDRSTSQDSSLRQERTGIMRSQPAGVGVLYPHDAELTNNYVTSACFTATDEAERFAIWQGTIPSIALSCSYLRHGLLAFSAMHIRLTCSPDRRPFYASLARQHLSKAPESYIPQLGTNTGESCPALFAFSSLLPALSYSFLQAVRTDLQGEDYIKQFIRIWHFLLGATAVAKGGRRWINESILAPLVTLKSIENVLPQVADSPRTALQGLLDQIRLSGLSAAPRGQGEHHRTQADTLSSEARQRSLHEGSVEMLSNAFPTNTNQPPRLPAVIGWPVFIEGGFVQLLARKDPMALIILAYYGAALHTLSGFWWLQGLGARLVQAVSKVLGPDSSPLFLWPLTETSLII